MATFIPAIDVVRVAVEMNQEGHVTVNVYHALSPHPVTVADLTTLGTIFASWVTNHLIGVMGTNTSVTNLNLRDLTTASGPILDVPMTTGNVGTVTGTPLTNSVAQVASWRTGLAGRSFRGRTYFPGLTDAMLVSGTPNFTSTARATNLLNAAAALQTALSGGSYELVVASFRHGGAPRTTAVVTPPTSIIVNTKVDNQRKRLKGAG